MLGLIGKFNKTEYFWARNFLAAEQYLNHLLAYLNNNSIDICVKIVQLGEAKRHIRETRMVCNEFHRLLCDAQVRKLQIKKL